MSNTVRIQYPNLSTELELHEFFVTGDSLDITVRPDQRTFAEVESGEDPISFTGSDFDDTIVGGAGRDTIDGGAGDDTLEIGFGDTVTGGGGADKIVINLSQTSNLNAPPVITDFTSGEEEITLTGVDRPSDSVVFDTNTGVLILDGQQVVKLDEGIINQGDLNISGDDPDPGDDDITLDKVNTAENTVYRFFDPTAGGHFYTIDEGERDFVEENLDNYLFEGETYNAGNPVDQAEAEEVYRFFNPSTGVHLYSTDEGERDFIIDNLDNFVYEGVKFHAFETQVEGSIPVYRFFVPTLGVHFYTSDEGEKDFVEANLDNYDFERIAYYAMPLASEMSDI